MPHAVPPAVRQAIWNRSRSGHANPVIARELEIPESTVRRLVRQLKSRGQEALRPAYHRCGRPQTETARQLRQAALELRRAHQGWGAGRIRLELLARPGCACERTIQRWLKQAGLAPAPKGRRKAPGRSRAEAPHQVWQVDAAEQKKLASGQVISWMRVVDECSGAVLKTVVFPPGALSPGVADPGAAAVASGVRNLGASGGGAGR